MFSTASLRIPQVERLDSKLKCSRGIFRPRSLPRALAGILHPPLSSPLNCGPPCISRPPDPFHALPPPPNLSLTRAQAVDHAPDSLLRDGTANTEMRAKFEKMCREAQVLLSVALQGNI